jgi:cytosine/adenosine deaminase-related metal-dependent hydrolase
MTKKVFKADFIISSSKKIYENSFILLDDDKIIDISEDFKKDFNNYAFYDYSNHVIMPGLIDSHIHSYQVGNRGKNVKKSLIDWLITHILPWESNLTPEKARISALLAYTEMIESGTTTFSDFTSVNHTEEAFKVAEMLGLRAFIGKTMMNINAPEKLKQTTSEALKDSVDLIKKWHKKNNGRLNFALTPRFDLTCDNDLFLETLKISEKYDVLMQTHTQETQGELDFEMEHYGKHAIAHLNELGVLNDKCVLAHCVYMSDEDIQILKDTKASVVHNPGSNMLLNSGIAPIPLMLREGINVSLGSDVVAYHNFNLFEQARLTYNMHILNEGFASLSPRDVFDIATINGAKSLHIDNEVGTLEIGKKADMIILKLDTHHYPISDIIDNMILTANKNDVVASIVDGEFILKDGKIVNFDKSELFKMLPELI